MLEFDDIQYILLTRVPALTGRYEFLSFQQPAQGRAWLDAIREKVPSAKAVADTVNLEKRWVSVALTWNGYARSEWMTRRSRPFRRNSGREWRRGGRSSVTPVRTIPIIGSVALVGRSSTRSPSYLRAMRQRETERSRARGAIGAHTRCGGVVVAGLRGDPPSDKVREHFGYRDRLTTPEIEGTGIVPTPGSGPPIKAGEFILGYPDEDGPPPKLPSPKSCLVMAATWRIDDYGSTWARSATFCASKAGRPQMARSGLPQN